MGENMLTYNSQDFSLKSSVHVHINVSCKSTNISFETATASSLFQCHKEGCSFTLLGGGTNLCRTNPLSPPTLVYTAFCDTVSFKVKVSLNFLAFINFINPAHLGP